MLALLALLQRWATAHAATISTVHTATISTAITTTVSTAHAATVSTAHAATVRITITTTILRISIAAGHASSAACDSEGRRGLLVGLRQQRWRVPWVLRRVWRVLPAFDAA